MRPGFPVHKVVLLDSLLVLVLLQVLTHLHVLRVGLEVGVGGRRRVLGLLQLGSGKREERGSASAAMKSTLRLSWGSTPARLPAVFQHWRGGGSAPVQNSISHIFFFDLIHTEVLETN